MVLDNDIRGWIMTCSSGIACICGASIICVDIFIRMIPGYRNFEIAASDTFLSASLSLSFGVMLFSALYNMLPNAKTYLISAGFGPRPASYLLIALFLAGVVGIQILSRALHHFVPTHIVDCDHTHDGDEAGDAHGQMEEQRPEHEFDLSQHEQPPKLTVSTNENDEERPLLARQTIVSPTKDRYHSATDTNDDLLQPPANGFLTAATSRRPSILPRSLTRTLTKITSPNVSCDETGPCKGYSDPCGQDCFKVVTRRGSGAPNSAPSRQTAFLRSPLHLASSGHSPPVREAEEGEHTVTRTRSNPADPEPLPFQRSRSATHHYHHLDHQHDEPVKHDGHQHSTRSNASYHSDAKPEHHHHVPTNAFLSIGLQTSLAIALHKAPEGFITYATNHANPTLGFAVFMALFIHNITEGFAMALPLYLALLSRTKAIIWASFLGGVSQPLGAAVAALWFKVAKGSNGIGKPSEGVYGCMFAITAGVMASVALQLFSESLGLTHNKTVCIGFAFLGMGILGVSSALSA